MRSRVVVCGGVFALGLDIGGVKPFIDTQSEVLAESIYQSRSMGQN